MVDRDLADWLRSIRSTLQWIAGFLLALVFLAFTALMIWAPDGWWHTPFWAL